MTDTKAGIKRGSEFIDDVKKVRTVYGCGLVEAKALMDRFGSYEAVHAHLGDNAVVEPITKKVERLERELAEAHTWGQRCLVERDAMELRLSNEQPLREALASARCPNLGWHANGVERTDTAPKCHWCETRAKLLNAGVTT